MNLGWLTLIFLLILLFLLLNPANNTTGVINSLAKLQMQQVMALQGRFAQ